MPKQITGRATSVIILLFFVFTFFDFDIQTHRKTMAIDNALNEGYVAFIVNESQNVQPDDEDEQEQCDGSGFITHGDGHKTPCPGCRACQKSSEPTEEKAQEITTEEAIIEKEKKKKQLLYFTATWCTPCTQFKTQQLSRIIANGSWKVNEKEDAHIRIVDIDKPQNDEIITKYKQTRSVPEFVLVVNEKVDSFKQGYQKAENIVEWYNAR
jgi:thiol-disulfide isomerase/thioredoxin